DFIDVLDSTKANILPLYRKTDYTIELLLGTTLLVGLIYLLARKELNIFKEYLYKNLAKGILEPSYEPRLNKIIRKNCYLLPLILEILNYIIGIKYFSKLDVKEAYYRI
ncbi:uncharacterized protein THITE_2015448, partial [Thermothielavioides terrestris NRRL 8126]